MMTNKKKKMMMFTSIISNFVFCYYLIIIIIFFCNDLKKNRNTPASSSSLSSSSLLLFVNGGTVEEWPAFIKNECQNPSTDIFIDFEEGIESIEVSKTYPTVQFTNTGGLDWLYGDIRSGEYNANGIGNDFYATNGEFFVWLGRQGDMGRIDFTGSRASYFSVLVSVATQGLEIVAYDVNGNVLDSARAVLNTWQDKSNPRPPVTRLTVTDQNPDGAGGGNIAYVQISASGNFWLIDDICTDASAPCRPLPTSFTSIGPPSKRIDLVFLKDAQYTGTDMEFNAIVTDMINLRLFQHEPLASKKHFFNFYISDVLIGDSDPSFNGFRCGPQILPSNFYELCPFADSVAVVHSETYGDCSSGNVFGTEDDLVRSFIHEVSHAALGLFDEYDDSPRCRTLRPSISYNVYLSEEDCRNDAINNSFNPDLCFLFTTCSGEEEGEDGSGDGLWKIQQNSRFIMHDGVFYMNGYSISSIWRLNDYFNNLALGLPKPIGARERASNTRSILMEFTISNDNSLDLITTSLIISPSPQYININLNQEQEQQEQTTTMMDFTVDLSDNNGTILGSFSFEDPRKVTSEQDYNGPLSFDQIDYTLIVPYYPDISNALISLNNNNNNQTISSSSLLNVDLRFLSGLPSPALRADTGGPYIIENDQQNQNQKSILFSALESLNLNNYNISSYEWDIEGDGTVDIITTEPTVEYIIPSSLLSTLSNSGGIALLLTIRTIDNITSQDQTILMTTTTTMNGCQDFPCTSLFFFNGIVMKFNLFFGFLPCINICILDFMVNFFRTIFGVPCGNC